MDHAGDVVDVDAAGGDVGGDEGLDPAGGEGRQGPLPLGLGAVAVDGHGGHAGLGELLGDPVGAALGAAEDDVEPCWPTRSAVTLEPLVASWSRTKRCSVRSIGVGLGHGHLEAHGVVLVADG